MAACNLYLVFCLVVIGNLRTIGAVHSEFGMKIGNRRAYKFCAWVKKSVSRNENSTCSHSNNSLSHN